VDSRRRLSAAAFVGASLTYIVTTVAFTGEFDVGEWTVFAVVFLLVFAAAARLFAWDTA
jgi:hypothetical protein